MAHDDPRPVYRWIRVAGFLSFIPILMAAGPLACYFVADYLHRQYNTPEYVSWIMVIAGFIAAGRETVKIIRLALKADVENRE